MLLDAPQPPLWIPRCFQPHRKHDVDALKRALRDVLQRIITPQPIEYSVSSHAAENFQQLKAASTSRLVVLGPFSDRTIYGEPAYNHLQRACHDNWHLRLNADTDVHGEYRVAIAQANEVARVGGDTVADFVFADLFGQTLFMQKYLRFPEDQVGFVLDFITTGRIELF